MALTKGKLNISFSKNNENRGLSVWKTEIFIRECRIDRKILDLMELIKQREVAKNEAPDALDPKTDFFQDYRTSA